MSNTCIGQSFFRYKILLATICTIMCSLNVRAQCTTNHFTIDSLVVNIRDHDVRIKHVSGDTFKAYVPIKNGFNVFLFESETHQVASNIDRFVDSYYDGLQQTASFGTSPSDNKMRADLHYVCRGVYDGGYNILEKETGSYKNDKLDGLISVQKSGGNYWYGTSQYKAGQKHGIDSCTNGRYTNVSNFVNGKKQRMQVYNAYGNLLRDRTYFPTYRLKTYDTKGRLTRIIVQDSIHLYYKHNALRYSFTHNIDKDLWEEKSFYPSGQIERYCAHKNYNHSPISEPVWYDESGKVMDEPEPELMVEEMMDYQTVQPSYTKATRSVSSEADLLTIRKPTELMKNVDSALNSQIDFKIKKKQTGNYKYHVSYRNFFTKTTSFNSMEYPDEEVSNKLSQYLTESEEVAMGLQNLSNYPILYFSGTIKLSVSKAPKQ